jgi:hypothetical protein
MTLRRLVLVLLALMLTSSVSLATSNYEYGPDEYVTVARGISPDGKLAITAHGAGDLGYENFHLYLTDAITGKNLSSLKEIVDTRDTGAGAFKAKWSLDSRQVTIIYRVGRPLKAVIYRIGHREAHRVKGPFDVKSEDLMRYWQSDSLHSSPRQKILGTPMHHDDPNS